MEQKNQFADVYTELATIAKVQSVKSSNAMEGIVTTDERINEIVNGNSAPKITVSRRLPDTGMPLHRCTRNT